MTISLKPGCLIHFVSPLHSAYTLNWLNPRVSFGVEIAHAQVTPLVIVTSLRRFVEKFEPE